MAWPRMKPPNEVATLVSKSRACLAVLRRHEPVEVGQDAVLVEDDEERQEDDDQQVADDAQAEQRDVGQRPDQVAADVAQVGQQIARGRDEIDLEAEALQGALERRQDLGQPCLELGQLGDEVADRPGQAAGDDERDRRQADEKQQVDRADDDHPRQLRGRRAG